MTNGHSGHDDVRISCTYHGDLAKLAIVGELDMKGAPQVSAEVEQVLAMQQAVTGVEIDMTGVTFIDSAGLQSLLVARESLQRGEIGFRLTAISPAVERVIDLASLREVLIPDAVGRPSASMAAATERNRTLPPEARP